MTPAIVVVLTAPRPTSMIPSFPSALSIVDGFFTTADYIELMIWCDGAISRSGNSVIC
jgi:hypothetical protein